MRDLTRHHSSPLIPRGVSLFCVYDKSGKGQTLGQNVDKNLEWQPWEQRRTETMVESEVWSVGGQSSSQYALRAAACKTEIEESQARNSQVMRVVKGWSRDSSHGSENGNHIECAVDKAITRQWVGNVEVQCLNNVWTEILQPKQTPVKVEVQNIMMGPLVQVWHGRWKEQTNVDGENTRYIGTKNKHIMRHSEKRCIIE